MAESLEERWQNGAGDAALPEPRGGGLKRSQPRGDGSFGWHRRRTLLRRWRSGWKPIVGVSASGRKEAGRGRAAGHGTGFAPAGQTGQPLGLAFQLFDHLGDQVGPALPEEVVDALLGDTELLHGGRGRLPGPLQLLALRQV